VDFSIPPEDQELLAGLRSFIDRQVRPVEARFQPEIQRLVIARSLGR
jgi:hypothetical protein